MSENSEKNQGYSIRITWKHAVVSFLLLAGIIAIVWYSASTVTRIESLEENVAKVDSINQLQEGDLDQANKNFGLMDSSFENLETSIISLDTTQKEVFTSFASFKNDYVSFKNTCNAKFAKMDKLEKKVLTLEAALNSYKEEQASNYQSLQKKVNQVDTLTLNYNKFMAPAKTDTIPSDTTKVDGKKKKKNRFGIPRRDIKLETDGSKLGW